MSACLHRYVCAGPCVCLCVRMHRLYGVCECVFAAVLHSSASLAGEVMDRESVGVVAAQKHLNLRPTACVAMK